MRILSAAELVIARVMRDRGDSWRKIGIFLNHRETLVRDTLVAEGYKRDSRPGRTPRPKAQRRAYQMYIVQGETLTTTARALNVGVRRARTWVIAEGGEIRGQRETRVHGICKAWGAGVACAIGAVKTGGHPAKPIGSYYCAEVCDWHKGKCGAEVTPENRTGFKVFKTHRAEHERKRRADPKVPRRHGNPADGYGKGKSDDVAR